MSANAPTQLVQPARRARRLRWALLWRSLAAWAATLLLFFPLGWLMLTAFKTELQAIAQPPLLIFMPTLDNFHEQTPRPALQTPDRR